MDDKPSEFKVIPGMINVGLWAAYEPMCQNNRLFSWPDPDREGMVIKRLKELRRQGQDRGINLISIDTVDDVSLFDCFLFSDFPLLKNPIAKKAFGSGKPMFLIIEESEIGYPANWDPRNHHVFEKIFTWRDDLVDNKKYFKFDIYFGEIKNINKDLSKKKKLCTAIMRNKASSHPLELFSKRREAVDWFEQHHCEEFDLYGDDWDLCSFFMDKRGWARLGRGKLKGLSRILAKKHPSWKGAIVNKKAILEQYKFSLSYENERDVPGYISEKIFDCFAAGTVPIYWGAQNITDHIPGNCFIDKRNFDTYDDLFRFMKTMSESDYQKYLSNTEDFLSSEKVTHISNGYFFTSFINEVLKTLRKKPYGNTSF